MTYRAIERLLVSIYSFIVSYFLVYYLLDDLILVCFPCIVDNVARPIGHCDVEVKGILMWTMHDFHDYGEVNSKHICIYYLLFFGLLSIQRPYCCVFSMCRFQYFKIQHVFNLWPLSYWFKTTWSTLFSPLPYFFIAWIPHIHQLLLSIGNHIGEEWMRNHHSRC